MVNPGILIALREEALDVLSDSFWGWTERGENRWVSSRTGARLAVSGCGKAFASAQTPWLCENGGPVIAAGTGGSLSHHPVGSLVLCSESVERDMDASPLGIAPGVTPFLRMDGPVMASCPETFLSEVRLALRTAGIPFSEARIASGDSFVADAEEGKSIMETFGAEIVDMESAAVAKVSRFLFGRPFLSIRVVTDNADHAAAHSWNELVSSSSKTLNAALRALVPGLT